MTARVAFVIDIVDSYGERELAMRFAERLHDPADAVFVVAHPLAAYFQGRFEVHEYTALEQGIEMLHALAPRVVVCVEIFNLPAPLRAAVAAGPWALATTDGTTIGLAINTDPWQTGAPSTLTLPDHLITLRSCPISDPDAGTGRGFSWELWPGLARGAPSPRVAKHLVLMAISAWSARVATRTDQRAHYDLLFERLIDALQHAGDTVELVVVTNLQQARARFGNVTVRFVELLPAVEFERLLLGCDLVAGDSVIQMSLAKAFCAGIPVLPVLNHRPALGPVYDIFPLAVACPPTRYRAAIAPVELGDTAELRARVRAALAGRDPTVEAPHARAYRAALSRLRSPAEIIEAMARG